MPDLNETVLPVVWSLAHSALRVAPAASRDDLIDRLTPAGLIERSIEVRSRHVRPSVRALEEIGVIEVHDESGVALADPGSDDIAFRLAVATRLLTVPDDDDVWRARPDGAQLEHHAQIAVAWLCLQGVGKGVAGWAEAADVLTRQFGIDRPLLRDTAPYNTLERLVRWLGIGAFLAGRGPSPMLVPDPTPLVRATLDDLAPPGSAVTMAVFLSRAAERFPWLPHGRVGRAVAGRMRDVPDDSGEHDRCPQCLSLALVRLELEGLVLLDQGDDPLERVSLSLTGGATHPVARVVRQ